MSHVVHAKIFEQAGKNIFFLCAALLIEIAEIALIFLGWELERFHCVVVEIHAELDTFVVYALRIIRSVHI